MILLKGFETSRRRRAGPPCSMLFIFILLSFFVSSVFGEILPDTSETETIMSSLKETISVLSEQGNRSTGSPANKEAALYIRERLAQTNPAQMDSFHFTVPILQTRNSQIIIGDTTADIQPIYYNAITPQSLPPEGLQGELAYVGKGELADFNGKKIEGAIVLMEFDSGRNWLNAASLGASALIYINRGITPKSQFQSKEELSPVQFPCFWIEEQDLAGISAGKAAEPELFNGIQVRLQSRTQWREVKTQNVYALYPGTNPELKDQLLVVEAFYDSSLFIPGRSPGADEALSIAGLLQLADSLSRNPPQRPFLLIANGGHAQGLAGMRETIWAVNARSKDLRSMDKRLKADKKTRSAFIEILEKYKEGLIEESESLLLQDAINHALKIKVDTISSELMRLRMRQDKSHYAEEIKDLAHQRLVLRRLGWLSNVKDINQPSI